MIHNNCHLHFLASKDVRPMVKDPHGIIENIDQAAWYEGNDVRPTQETFWRKFTAQIKVSDVQTANCLNKQKPSYMCDIWRRKKHWTNYWSLFESETLWKQAELQMSLIWYIRVNKLANLSNKFGKIDKLAKAREDLCKCKTQCEHWSVLCTKALFAEGTVAHPESQSVWGLKPFSP